MIKSLQYKDCVISYYQYGKGVEVLFCFHGYGQQGRVFAPLAEAIEDRFTLYCIDLPIHGSTFWPSERLCTPSDINQIILLLLPKGVLKWSLLGYSLGGRIALSLLNEQASAINQMVLIAPDGISIQFWQYVATQFNWGRALFRYTMNHPTWFFGLLFLVGKLGIFDNRLIKFAKFHIHTDEKRQYLLRRWLKLRSCTIGVRKAQQLINEHLIITKLVLGKYDRVITVKAGERFAENQPQIKAYQLPTGHLLLIEPFAQQIAKLLV